MRQMAPEREPLRTDMFGMLFGAGLIVAAFLMFSYLPSDIPGGPWFWLIVIIGIQLFGIGFVIVGTVRLVQGLLQRRK
jgi:hypothetical protein